MSSLSKSHNVCTGCRSRKKKCNGERPSCSLCRKRGEICFYAGAPSQSLSTSLPNEWLPVSGLDLQQDVGSWAPPVDDFDPSAQLDWSSIEHANLNQDSGVMAPPISLDERQKSPPSNNDLGIPTPQSSTSSSAPITLPPLDQLKQLVDLYFEKLYQYLPLIHKPTLLSKLDSNYEDSPLLFFSIIAVSASAHPNREIQQSQTDWYNTARTLFSEALHSQNNALEAIIAANFITFQAVVATEYSTAWVTLGEAWRRAVTAGYSILDSATEMVAHALVPKSRQSWIEMEQCRRSVWLLFITDRAMCFPVGLVHGVDDRQLRINLPMNEDSFQSTEEPSEESSVLYTRNLDRLITLIQGKARAKTATMLQFVILSYVFLGRVVETIYTLDYEFEEQKSKLDELESSFLRIRLMLPRYATDLAAADYREFPSVVWLHVVLNLSAVLLYHRPLHDGETLDDKTELSTNWPHCVSAARSSVSILRDASRASTDFAINPYLSSMLFTIGRILVMEYFFPSINQKKSSTLSQPPSVSKRDAKLRDDLEVLLFTSERMKETHKGIGRKFRNGIVFYITDDENRILQDKTSGSKGLLRTCERWPQVDECIDFEFPA